MTAVDLLSHRSGLPRHDLFWYATGKSRTELIAGLHHLEPSASFRSKYQYQNLMFLTAGVVAERIGGKSWEELVEERVLRPLGMERATFSVDQMQQDDDFSYGYGAEQEIERVPFRNIDAIGPAGSINTSARELARYVQFHLAYGKVGDTQLLKEDSARLMQLPQMVMTGPLQERLQDGPEISDPTYGLGLMVGGYRGRKHISHGGGIDGFISAMQWLPDEQIGVIALSNTSHTGTVPALVVRNAFDRMLGLEPIDWAARARKRENRSEGQGRRGQEGRPRGSGGGHQPVTPARRLRRRLRAHRIRQGLSASSRGRPDPQGRRNRVPARALPLRPVHRPLRSSGQRGRGRIRRSQGPLRLRRRGGDQRRFRCRWSRPSRPSASCGPATDPRDGHDAGPGFIEKAKTWSRAALYQGYCAFALLVLTAPVEAAAAHPPAAVPETGVSEVIVAALLYVAYNVAVVPGSSRACAAASACCWQYPMLGAAALPTIDATVASSSPCHGREPGNWAARYRPQR